MQSNLMGYFLYMPENLTKNNIKTLKDYLVFLNKWLKDYEKDYKKLDPELLDEKYWIKTIDLFEYDNEGIEDLSEIIDLIREGTKNLQEFIKNPNKFIRHDYLTHFSYITVLNKKVITVFTGQESYDQEPYYDNYNALKSFRCLKVYDLLKEMCFPNSQVLHFIKEN